MADDPLETALQAILDEYETITGDPTTGQGGEALELVFGNLKRDENASFPQISWVETGGKFVVGRGASGDNEDDVPEALGVWVDLEVWIWRETAAECRDAAFNLVAAARLAVDPPDLKWGDYDRPEDKHENSGVEFRLRMQLRLSSPLNGTAGYPRTVTIESHYGEDETTSTVNVAGPVVAPVVAP